MDILTVLTTARDLIADPEHWTQEALAIQDTRASVDPCADSAYAWCALGAIDRAIGPTYSHDQTRHQAAGALAVGIHYSDEDVSAETVDVAEYNDTHDHSDVIRAFDCAIKMVRR